MKPDQTSSSISILRAPRFYTVKMHLVATWVCLAASRIYGYRILSTLRDLNVQSPPLFPGVWLFGCGIQLVVTIIALTKFCERVRVPLYVLYGYWLCVIVSLTACLLYHSNVLIR